MTTPETRKTILGFLFHLDAILAYVENQAIPQGVEDPTGDLVNAIEYVKENRDALRQLSTK